MFATNRKRGRTLAPTLFLAMTAAVGLGPAWTAQADAQTQQTVNYTCTHNPEPFSVPKDVTLITIEAQGASGQDAGGTGGRGAILQAVMPVTDGQLLTVKVACQDSWGFAAGGVGGHNADHNGVNGGGATGISIGGDPILVAGGGGGGAGNGVYNTCWTNPCDGRIVSSTILTGGAGGDAFVPPDSAATSSGGDGPGAAGAGGAAGAATCAGDTNGANTGDFNSGSGGGGGGGYDGTGHGCGGAGAAGQHYNETNAGLAYDGHGAGGGGGGGASYFAPQMTNRSAHLATTRSDGKVTITFSSAAATMVNFNCSGSATTYTVPSGVNSLRVFATGGAGASSKSGATNAAAGATVSGMVPVTAPSVLNVGVGCAGTPGSAGAAGAGTVAGGAGGFGYYSGGYGGRSRKLYTSTTGFGGGGGGGATGIGLPGHDLLVAAGGGGWGGGNRSPGGAGGAGNVAPGSAWRTVAGGSLGGNSSNNGGNGADAPDGSQAGGGGGGGGGVAGGGGGSTVSSATMACGVSSTCPSVDSGGGGGGGLNFKDPGVTDAGFAVVDPKSPLWIFPMWGVKGCPTGNSSATGCYDPSTATVRGAPSPIPAGMTAPFFRLFGTLSKDHLYTTSTTEARLAIQNSGYSPEGTAAFISPVARAGLVPLYRLTRGGNWDRLYVTSTAERDQAIATQGFTSDGVAGYISASAQKGLVPLFRLYSSGAGKHMFTTSVAERDNTASGYQYEGITGYVAPVAP